MCKCCSTKVAICYVKSCVCVWSQGQVVSKKHQQLFVHLQGWLYVKATEVPSMVCPILISSNRGWHHVCRKRWNYWTSHGTTSNTRGSSAWHNICLTGTPHLPRAGWWPADGVTHQNRSQTLATSASNVIVNHRCQMSFPTGVWAKQNTEKV